MRSMVADGLDIERTGKRDRYRRSLAHNHYRGQNVASIIVLEGYAVPYECGKRCGRRIDWCAKLANDRAS